jgi:hypothetical protein
LSFAGMRGAGFLAFPHPFDDHFINPFQRRMLRLGGWCAVIWPILSLGRDGLRRIVGRLWHYGPQND